MSSTTATLEDVLAHVDANFDTSVERLKSLLRIPSVSTDPAHDADTFACAESAAALLSASGFSAQVVKTDGHPMVLAHHAGPGGDAPRVLYYGHYDVQPPDPLELWDSAPFEPVVVETKHGKRIVARGAVDDKGQVMTILEAMAAFHDVRGAPPCAVTVLLEGEEESGSPSLLPFLESHGDALAANVCIVSDTGMWDIETPAITTMLRGMVYLEVTVSGPTSDLHSGMYGGAVLNPINELGRLIGLIHDDAGRVQFGGFYDDVIEVPAEQLQAWNDLGFDEQGFLGCAGLREGHGEAGRSTLERTWSRPTCDINGIIGGYTGEGAKTVIASHASCKLSCRLVAGQDPQAIEASIKQFFTEHVRGECSLKFASHGLNPAIQVPTDSTYLKAATAALKAVFGREPLLIGTGGSIPAVGAIQDVLGIDSLLIGFGLDDDNVHAPNEKFELRCLHNGIRSHVSVLEAIAGCG